MIVKLPKDLHDELAHIICQHGGADRVVDYGRVINTGEIAFHREDYTGQSVDVRNLATWHEIYGED